MFRCSIHGLTDLARVCSHVAAARAAGQREPTHVARDGFGVPMLICSRCLGHHGSRIAYEWDDGPEAECYDCLIEWHASTGQGDLLSRYEIK